MVTGKRPRKRIPLGDDGLFSLNLPDHAAATIDVAAEEEAVGIVLDAIDELHGVASTPIRRDMFENGLTPRFIANLYRHDLMARVRPMNRTPNEAEMDVAWLDSVMEQGIPPVLAVWIADSADVCYVPLAPAMARRLVRRAWHREHDCPVVTGWLRTGERVALRGLPLARTLNRVLRSSLPTLTIIGDALESHLIAPEEGAGWLTFDGPAGGATMEVLEMEAYPSGK